MFEDHKDELIAELQCELAYQKDYLRIEEGSLLLAIKLNPAYYGENPENVAERISREKQRFDKGYEWEEA